MPLKRLFEYLTQLRPPSDIKATSVEKKPSVEKSPDANTPSSKVRTVEAKIGRKNYLIASDDDYLDHIKGEFEPDMVVLFNALIRPDYTVFDIGANIGCTSILFGNIARKVYSFEPSPSTYVYLERNIGAAQLDNVTPVNVGLGKERGKFELTFAKSNRSGGFGNHPEHGVPYQVIEPGCRLMLPGY